MFKRFSAVLMSLVLTAGVAQAATFNGQTVTLFHYFENTSYNPGPNDEPKIWEWGRGDYVAGPRMTLFNDPYAYYYIDLVGNTLTIDLFDDGWGSDGTTPATFAQNRGRNGLVLQDTMDVLPDFTALNLLSNGFSGTPLVSVSANELIFDFNGAGNDGGASATWSVHVVPVPATLPMMLAGIGLFAWIRRRNSAV